MKNLSLEERQILEDLLQKQQSKRSIGRLLGRSHSTILEELKRNKSPAMKYNAIEAHKRSLLRKNKKRKRSKIEISHGLKRYIINRITLSVLGKKIRLKTLMDSLDNTFQEISTSETFPKIILIQLFVNSITDLANASNSFPLVSFLTLSN